MVLGDHSTGAPLSENHRTHLKSPGQPNEGECIDFKEMADVISRSKIDPLASNWRSFEGE